jgi:hypothetical protein
MPVITIFGSSDAAGNSQEYDEAYRIGEILADAGFDIATGGYSGIMEAALNGAKDKNVLRIGVTTKFYQGKIKNEYVNKEIKTASYNDRLDKLIEIGDSYIVMPGGTGTLLELSKIWALKKRGILKDKLIICVGEQWFKTIQTMAMYSEEIMRSLELIKFFESGEFAANYVKEEFNRRV